MKKGMEEDLTMAEAISNNSKAEIGSLIRNVHLSQNMKKLNLSKLKISQMILKVLKLKLDNSKERK